MCFTPAVIWYHGKLRYFNITLIHTHRNLDSLRIGSEIDSYEFSLTEFTDISLHSGKFK